MTRLYPILLFSVAVSTLLFLAGYQMHSDVAAIANLAEGIVEGEVPHRDYWDTNPPLFAYLNVPAVWLGRLLHVAYPYAVYFLMGAVIAVSLWLTYRLMNRLPLENRKAWLLLLTFLAVQFPMYNFAQREHLTAVLILPYLLALICRLRGPAEAIASPRVLILIGVMAGVGFSIKPYFLLVWFSCEAYLVFFTRNANLLRRRENLAAVGIFILYFLFLVIEGNFIEAVPRIFNLYAILRPPWATSPFEGNPELGPLVLTPHRALAAAGLLAVYLRIRKGNSAFSFRANEIFLLAAAGFFVVMAIQGKNFDYHFLPFHLLALLAVAASLPKRVGPLVAGAFGLAYIWPTVVPTVQNVLLAKKSRGAAVLRVEEVARTIERFSSPGDYVAFFDNNPYPSQIALAVTRRKNAMPGPDNWPFYGLYLHKDPALVGVTREEVRVDMPSLSSQARFPDWERQYFFLIANKWVKTKPQMLFLRRYPLDLKRYLTAEPIFENFFADYRLVTQLKVGKEFDVYVRVARSR